MRQRGIRTITGITAEAGGLYGYNDLQRAGINAPPSAAVGEMGGGGAAVAFEDARGGGAGNRHAGNRNAGDRNASARGGRPQEGAPGGRGADSGGDKVRDTSVTGRMRHLCSCRE